MTARLVNWPDERYFADRDYTSNSMLHVYRKDPTEYRSRFIEGKKGKSLGRPAVLGTALHGWHLEGREPIGAGLTEGCPDTLRDARKWAKDLGLDQCEDTGPVLNAKEAQAVCGMREALVETSQYQPDEAEWTERVVLFEYGGHWCKAKIDSLYTDLIVDLKTTRHLTPSAFEKSVYEYGYLYQAAFYTAAIEALTGERRPFVFEAVCSKEPHPVYDWVPPPDVLAMADDDNRAHLDLLAESYWTNDWPKLT